MQSLPPNVLLEHDSLSAALAYLDRPLFKDDVWVVFGWRGYERLRTDPRFALVNLDGVLFLQLPSSYASICAALRNCKRREASVQELCLLRPVGQFKWALGELKSDLGSCQRSQILSQRLSDIISFSVDNWPLAMAPALYALEAAVVRSQYAEASIIIDSLQDYVDPVAVYEQFRIFFHGAPRDIVNSALGACSALLRYAVTGSGGIDHDSLALVRDMLDSDGWWRRLQRLLDDIADGLAKSGATGEIADQVRGQVAQVRSIVPGLIGFLERLAGGDIPSAAEIAPAHEALNELIQMIIHIESRRNALQNEFQERFGHA